MQRHYILRKHFGERASKILTSVSGGVSRQEGLMPGPHISSGSLRSPSPGLHFANTVLLCSMQQIHHHTNTRTNTPHKILADLFVLTSIKQENRKIYTVNIFCTIQIIALCTLPHRTIAYTCQLSHYLQPVVRLKLTRAPHPPNRTKPTDRRHFPNLAKSLLSLFCKITQWQRVSLCPVFPSLFLVWNDN